MSDLFANRWVLVTGASSGIGEAFARALAKRGARLILTARSRHKLEALAAELQQAHSSTTRVIPADLSEPGGADRLARDVDALGVFVEHLINNAGFGMAGAFVKGDPDTQVAMLRLNCESLMWLSRHYLPPMLDKRAGGIIHVASTAGHQPMPNMAVYAATKAFVISLSAALTEEVRFAGVRVTALCPGPVPTGFQAQAGITPGAERMAALGAGETVARALIAYERREAVYVPGAVNTMQTLVSKVLPRQVVARGIQSAMKRLGRG